MSNSTNRQASRTRPNYFYAIMSVALVLLLLGFFGLVVIQGQRLATAFKEKVNLLAELKPEVTGEEVTQLQEQLNQSEYVKPGSVQFISKEKGAELMRKDFGEDFLKLDLPNPLYDLITFNVKSAYMEPDSLTSIRQSLMADGMISDVYYQESLIDEIIANLQRIAYITLGIGLFLILVAGVLIHNTIRLALYSNRFLIKNMELVGASWEFISRPYLLKAVQHGLMSSVIAIGCLYFLLLWIRSDIPELQELQHVSSLLILFGALIVLGVLINLASTYFVVNKYLRMRIDDMY